MPGSVVGAMFPLERHSLGHSLDNITSSRYGEEQPRMPYLGEEALRLSLPRQGEHRPSHPAQAPLQHNVRMAQPYYQQDYRIQRNDPHEIHRAPQTFHPQNAPRYAFPIQQSASLSRAYPNERSAASVRMHQPMHAQVPAATHLHSDGLVAQPIQAHVGVESRPYVQGASTVPRQERQPELTQTYFERGNEMHNVQQHAMRNPTQVPPQQEISRAPVSVAAPEKSANPDTRGDQKFAQNPAQQISGKVPHPMRQGVSQTKSIPMMHSLPHAKRGKTQENRPSNQLERSSSSKRHQDMRMPYSGYSSLRMPHSLSSPSTIDHGGTLYRLTGSQSVGEPSKSLQQTGSRPSSRPTTPKRIQSKMITVHVKMLDDSITTFQLSQDAPAKILFDQVCKQMNLLETDYFGLEYEDYTGTSYILDHTKRMSKQVNLVVTQPLLRFCVKFYSPDPAQLEDEYTRYLFALQIKRDLASGELHCNDATSGLMASYIVQAECGDFAAEDYPDHRYLSIYKFVPHQNEELEKRIMENHKKHVGQSPAESDLNLLETARRCELYGVKMHFAKDHAGVPLNLAVLHMGVVVYQNLTKINSFYFAKIRKISFKRKKFLLKLHPELGYAKYGDTVEFYFEGRDECKNFWKKCVEHHGFFRCTYIRKTERPKQKILSRGSYFRYSGRTQKQLQEDLRETLIRRKSFYRSSSFLSEESLHSNAGTLERPKTPAPLLPLDDDLKCTFDAVATPDSEDTSSQSISQSQSQTQSLMTAVRPSATPLETSRTESVDVHDYNYRDIDVADISTSLPTFSRQDTMSSGNSISSTPQKNTCNEKEEKTPPPAEDSKKASPEKATTSPRSETGAKPKREKRNKSIPSEKGFDFNSSFDSTCTSSLTLTVTSKTGTENKTDTTVIENCFYDKTNSANNTIPRSRRNHSFSTMSTLTNPIEKNASNENLQHYSSEDNFSHGSYEFLDSDTASGNVVKSSNTHLFPGDRFLRPV